jgi:hypothetical protein
VLGIEPGWLTPQPGVEATRPRRHLLIIKYVFIVIYVFDLVDIDNLIYTYIYEQKFVCVILLICSLVW